MTHLVEFQIGNTEESGIILAEVEEPVSGATQRVALNPGKLAYQATQSFSEAMAKTIKPVATAIIDNVRELQDAPDEVEITFGLTMSMQAGAVVASAKGDTNFSVKLKWSRSQGS